MAAPKSKTIAARAARRRASTRESVRRWRQRQRRHTALYTIEIGEPEFNLLERFGKLPADINDRKAVARALSDLLHHALLTLLQHTPRP